MNIERRHGVKKINQLKSDIHNHKYKKYKRGKGNDSNNNKKVAPPKSSGTTAEEAGIGLMGTATGTNNSITGTKQ